MTEERGRNNQYGIDDSREMIGRDDIMAKAGELASLISTSEEVRHFQKAEEKIQNHARVQGLISQIKKKQKEIVAFESLGNKTMVERIEAEINELQDEIDSIPLVADFQQSQTDINDLLQLVVSVIRDTVSEKINVETGKDTPPSKCGD
ncbi:RicAFT regulatory complex protein RicA family protein [Paenibacillus sp. HN-1]|uniref:RicAFT regulatory complex protein RicA family protein n=1 Tax=Paenibacillus TaxID=44249 RepID=UPI001CA84540|nr:MULTISPECIES: YlbF family regulator [Paenibacillus]MBY9081971.1 RicAFT regulatory complex protein RicA family protein [Paenibacillus sp. CGMCC 1.18879]MBY9085871.1 RicAFT regulatory complex protein RicA family protein [Paenibacillus sinensis]